MSLWYYSWMIIFWGSTAAFAVIAIIVVVLGSFDLANMLRGLSRQEREKESQSQ